MSLRKLAEKYVENAREVLEMVRRGEVEVHEAVEVAWRASALLRLGVEGVEKELRRLATTCGGCVSCKHSEPFSPSENPSLSVDLVARKCRLGLAQGTCGAYERIE